MKKIFLLTLFITTVNIAQDSYHKGHYIDIDNRKFDVQIKEYGFDDNITSLYYKENDSEQELSLPIEQVELFTYKKGREFFIYREVNFPNEKGEENLENSDKIFIQLIASGKNTSLFFRKYKDDDEFYYMDNHKEVYKLIDSTYKKNISENLKFEEEEINGYSFDKISLTLMVNLINSLDLYQKNANIKQLEKKALNEEFEIPVFDGCNKELSSEEKVKCFNKKMIENFAKNFIFPSSIKATYSEFNVIFYLHFIIEKDGTISLKNITNSPSEDANIEFYRVIDLLPKAIPGKKHGKPIRVKYSLPFNLRF